MTVFAAIVCFLLSFTMYVCHPAMSVAAVSGATTGATITGAAATGAATTGTNIYEQRYHRVWKLVQDNFLYGERLAGWQRWEHKYDGQLFNDSQTRRAISELLDSLHDDYTYLRDQQKTAADRREGEPIVSAQMLPDGIGYIKIRSFESPKAPEQTRRAIKSLGQATQYILDLRNNHGGLMENAYAIFGMLCRKSAFGSFIGRDDGQDYSETFTLKPESLEINHNGVLRQVSRQADETGGKPLVILVNSDTRSAAEMLAGALQANGRARLIGAKTFGKGVVQDVWDLSDGSSIKVTSAKFFLPSGNAIHGVGVTPDVSVTRSDIYDSSLCVAAALLQRKQLAGIKRLPAVF